MYVLSDIQYGSLCYEEKLFWLLFNELQMVKHQSINQSMYSVRRSPLIDILWNVIVTILLKERFIRVSYKKQELLTLLEHLSLPPGFWWVDPCCYIFSFLCMSCTWLVPNVVCTCREFIPRFKHEVRVVLLFVFTWVHPQI